MDPVSGLSPEVDPVSSLSTEVDTFSGLSTEVDPVSGLSTEVDPVSSLSTEVEVVSGLSTEVDPVSGLSTEVDPVSGFSPEVSGFSPEMNPEVGTIFGSVGSSSQQTKPSRDDLISKNPPISHSEPGVEDFNELESEDPKTDPVSHVNLSLFQKVTKTDPLPPQPTPTTPSPPSPHPDKSNVQAIKTKQDILDLNQVRSDKKVGEKGIGEVPLPFIYARKEIQRSKRKYEKTEAQIKGEL